MAQLLALDWDAAEARYVLATGAGQRLKIQAVGSVPLSVTGEDDRSAANVGPALREALAPLRLRRCQVLVGLARNDVELLNLTLPPAKDAELVELVGHAVMRQSPALADDAIIDFIPLNEDPAQARIVTAAICPEESRKRAIAVCEAAGLAPTRLLLRPYALAAWMRHCDEAERGVSLLVCRAGDDLDLAIVAHETVTYSRTVRLPRHEDEAALLAGLLAEIRRTLLVAPQLEGTASDVERILLFGDQNNLAPWMERVEQELALPVVVVNPLIRGVTSAAICPDEPGRFAPLVGMLHDELRRHHPLDFLHPRKPPAPPDRRRQLTMAAVLLGAVVVAGAWHVWETLHELDTKNAELSGRLRELDESWKKAASKGAVVQSIENWQAASVNWLDELRDFCERFPSSRDAMVLNLSLSPSREGGGEINLNGLVRDPDIVLRMENGIRDDFHQMRIPRVQERVQDKNYSWHFESRILVKPRTREQYAARARGEEPPAKESRRATVPVAAAAPSSAPPATNGKETVRDK
jgi:Tfp pilus assembly PilM family ATPase